MTPDDMERQNEKDHQQQQDTSSSSEHRPSTPSSSLKQGREREAFKEEQASSQRTHDEDSTKKNALLVQWDAEHDPDNPLTWTSMKKVAVLAIISSGALCVTCSSSVVSSAYTGIEADLGASKEVAILGLSLFVIGLGVGPTFLSPLSEFYGRRPIYLIAFGCFFLLNFPVAFANHISIFLIFRFMTGFAGSAFLSVAGGSVSDMWTPLESFLPMSFYTCSPFLGPAIGPIYGGFIETFSNWRWCFYVIIIWAFLVFIALFLGTPETYAPVLLVKKARAMRQSTGETGYYAQHEKELEGKSLSKTIAISGTRVFTLLALEPMLFLLCLWSAVLLGILYLFFELYPIVFGKHDFKPYQTGLTYVGIAIGILLGLTTAPYFARRFKSKAEANGGVAPPEARLDMAKWGAFMTPIGLFIFAFTSYKNVFWIGPIIGSVFFGWGMIYIYISIFTYTVVQWRSVAASAMGANSVMRSSFAAGFPLFATQMTDRLGTTGTAALLAGLNCLIIPLPFIFARYGDQLRARSRFKG